MHKFSGGSGLFAQGVQNDVDERMRVACEELKEKHRLQYVVCSCQCFCFCSFFIILALLQPMLWLIGDCPCCCRKIAEDQWKAEEATNYTGNLKQKAYINDTDGVQRGGKAGVRADGFTGQEQAQKQEDKNHNSDDSDSDDDDLLMDGADEELEKIRAARLKQMKKLQEQKKFGFGDYREIIEPEFLKQVTSFKKVVCHFYHDEFQSCKVMDKHLHRICKLYPSVKFIKLNAVKAPFMTAKLAIKTLPTLVFFDDGVASDRVCGFAELGGGEDFKTRFLELRMMAGGVIEDESEFGAYPDDEEEFAHFSLKK